MAHLILLVRTLLSFSTFFGLPAMDLEILQASLLSDSVDTGKSEESSTRH